MKRLVLILAILALVAAACDGGDDAQVITDDPDAGPDVAVETDEPADDGGDAEAEGTEEPAEAAEAGVLNFSWGTPAGSAYDPHVANNQFVYPFLHPAYDRLLGIDDDGMPVPMLAESWEFLDDGAALELQLRDDVVFHDGEPFNADAVVANIERGKTLETSTITADLAAVESAEALDEHTVRLNLSAPAASLTALLADRAGMMVSPAAFENEDLDLMPVGSGPYRVVDHEPGNVIRYEAFEEYWNPDAQGLEQLNIYMQLDSETRLNALRSGEVDATWLNPDQVDEAEEAGLNVDLEASTAIFLMYLNKSEEPLSNPDVRRALSHAIDREGISEALFEGNCTPSVQLFPGDYWASSDEAGPELYPYDPDRARELLADAGYPDGFEMSTIVVNVPFYSSQAEALQAQFAEIGVDLELQILEPAQLLSSFTAEQTAESYYSQWPGATDPAATSASLLSETGFLNPGGYTNEEVLRLHTEGLATTDTDERAELYQEMSRIYAEEALHLTVCSPGVVYAYNDAVGGIDPDLKGMTDFRGVTVD